MNETYFVVIPADKSSYIEKCDGTLEQLQRLVDGYIEVVPTQNTEGSHVLVVDEDGKLKGSTVNRCACLLFGTARDLIAGTAILARRYGEEMLGFDKELAKDLCVYADLLNL